MATFDFIAQKDFRASLEADYKEMAHCLTGEAWKSVLVLAGSMVETLLIDYLVATPFPGRVSKDPLKMDLSEAIEICRGEKVLSDRAADLCAVIRSYRNLIHPGRMARLNEPPPDRDSATVASTLVNFIATELGAARIEKVGMTAAQIVSKIVKDENSLSILKHLLNETTEAQRASMLLELIPAAHREIAQGEFSDPLEASRLSTAFGVTFEIASDTTKRQVAEAFVRLLKEADSRHVEWYSDAFLHPGFLEHIDDPSKEFVKDYLFGRIGRIHTEKTLHILEGLGSSLTPADAARWVDPYVRLLIASTVRESVKQGAIRAFGETFMHTTGAFDTAVRARLSTWLGFGSVANNPDRKKTVQDLLAYVDIPF